MRLSSNGFHAFHNQEFLVFWKTCINQLTEHGKALEKFTKLQKKVNKEIFKRKMKSSLGTCEFVTLGSF